MQRNTYSMSQEQGWEHPPWIEDKKRELSHTTPILVFG